MSSWTEYPSPFEVVSSAVDASIGRLKESPRPTAGLSDPFPRIDQLPEIRTAASGPLSSALSGSVQRAVDEGYAEGVRRGYQDGLASGATDARGDIGYALERHAKRNGYSVVREYCGHGIGRGFHEEPQVLHYDSPETNVVLKPGMTFTIEPMVNAGKKEIRSMKDGWTVKTKDLSLSAQYEHTIVVTDNGCEILTLRKDDTIPAIISHDE